MAKCRARPASGAKSITVCISSQSAGMRRCVRSSSSIRVSFRPFRHRRTASRCSTITIRSSGAMRLRRAHFGLDAKRDLRQHITHLVRHPDFVRYLNSQRYEADADHARHGRQASERAVGAGVSLRRESQAGAVAGHHRTGTYRRHAARFRRQRLARIEDAAHRAVRFPGDDARVAAERGRARRAIWN